MQKNIAIYRSIDTWLEKQYAQLGLTGLQASAIMVLLDAHKISQSELADALGVDKSQLVDIRTIKIDEKLPPIDRWFSYLRQVKNPYCVRVGDIAIKLNFPDEH